MTRKYEKPLQPLASWTDTASSSDDSDVSASSADGGFILHIREWSANHLEYNSSYDPEDCAKDEKSRLDSSGTDHSLCLLARCACWSRRRILTALATLFLLILLWTTIHLSIKRARIGTDVPIELSEDPAFPLSSPTPGTEQSAGTSPTPSPTEVGPGFSIMGEGDVDTRQPTMSPIVPPTQSPTILRTLLTNSPTEGLTSSPSITVPYPTSPPILSPTALSTIPLPFPSLPPTMLPTLPPTPSPTTLPPSELRMTPPPTELRTTLQPTEPPTEKPIVAAIASQSLPIGQTVVLYPGEFLAAGQFRASPTGQYMVGLTEAGNFMLTDISNNNIWSTNTAGGGTRLYLQADGNVMVRDGQKTVLWSSETHGYPGAHLIVTDKGQLAIRADDSENAATIWMDGIPRSVYRGPPPHDLMFPIRGAFYYPWYPQTWYVNGQQAHYKSDLGMYSSSDPGVAASHIGSMDYAHIDLSIASWWGPNTHLDKARLTMLMDETVAMNSPLKWSVYHEDERDFNPSVEEIREDLNYLKKWFVWHEAWAHKDGKPVIFVYNEAGCDVARRWSEASNGEWFVVLKLFKGFMDCPSQPESWHQYGVGEEDGTIHNPGHSFVLSPGFWRADTDVPLVPRVNRDQFCQNTRRMVDSGEQWQLIVSFNEAGEGTMIENSPEWPSGSGYGQYLDCLHDNTL